MPEETNKPKFNPCDTPPNFTVPECDQRLDQVHAIRVGRTQHYIAVDIAGRIVHLNKEAALQLGQLIIENALKL